MYVCMYVWHAQSVKLAISRKRQAYCPVREVGTVCRSINIMICKTNCFTGYVATNLSIDITIPTQSDPVTVMSVFDWIIIHQHLGKDFDWNLTWADYKVGFGSIDDNFWLGLEKMHLLTKCQPYRLRVEVQQC